MKNIKKYLIILTMVCVFCISCINSKNITVQSGDYFLHFKQGHKDKVVMNKKISKHINNLLKDFKKMDDSLKLEPKEEVVFYNKNDKFKFSLFDYEGKSYIVKKANPYEMYYRDGNILKEMFEKSK